MRPGSGVNTAPGSKNLDFNSIILSINGGEPLEWRFSPMKLVPLYSKPSVVLGCVNPKFEARVKLYGDKKTEFQRASV